MKWERGILVATASLGLGVFARASALPDEIVGKPPNATAPPLTAFAWKSLNDLRFVWWLPKDYDSTVPCNMTVICHGVRSDYRWGSWNHKPGLFRPADIVVSVDGPTPDRENRIFSNEKKDSDAFGAFLTEMRRTFAVDRVFLYGYGQGGLFALSFAAEHPDVIGGVVAHGAGEWNGFQPGTEPRKVAIALLHGTSDVDAPFSLALDRRDDYAKAGWPLLLLRRLDRCGHEPNPPRAAEALAWCQGMTATKPEEALACALLILRPPPRDPQDREVLVGFAGARDVLRRLEKKGPVPFADVPADVASKASEWIAKVEDAGARHVAAIRALLKAKRIPKLDGGAWLGHIVPLRTNFRGVETVEAFMKDVGYDTLADSHRKAAQPILSAWVQEKEPKKIFAAVVDGIGKAFLFDGFPTDFAERMEAWHADPKKNSIPSTAEKKYADFEAWKKGWTAGLADFLALGKSWEGP